ncbi:MAG: 3-dehydroquinate synthase [Chloroflexi bacterium RBG_13_48_17]|nr:MAG: 3-dehydroquinate synthase [Chloroflexi bacterium RBG_13_48_17]
MRRLKENRNIAIIGFSATGKTVVAQKVAERLNWTFIDTDEEIVKLSGKTIPEIFKQDGEEKFRWLESQVLKQACHKEQMVIATGGGAIIDPKNQNLLLETSVVVCLEAKPETIYQRLLHDTLYSASPVVRPLLAGDNPLERIKQLKTKRQSYYAIADWTVHTDNLTVDEVSQEITKGWQYANRHRDKQSVEADLACRVQTPTAEYPVFVGWGMLDKLGEKMKQTVLSGTANIISDEIVFSIYGAKVRKALEKAGFAVNSCVVPAGEASKNINQATEIYDYLIEQRVERNDVIVALGGGMIGDLAGFVAATFLRGLPWLQVPTSLIAMTDASIGGKVAVDHPRGKNLIGAFYHPCLVLADVKTLTTLPHRELTSGWAEVIKHGLILDAEFLKLLEDKARDLVKLKPDITTSVIAGSAAIKCRVVSEDERETGKRTILNYGHTVAHGLEAATNYGCFLHGEAVAIGMMAAAKLSHRLKLLSEKAVERHEAILQKFGLPIDCSGVAVNDVLAAMELDKKVRGKAIRWVLLEDIGQVVIRSDVTEKDILAVLREVIRP